MIPIIITKTFRFDGGPEDQKPKLDYLQSFSQEYGVAVNNLHQYADSIVFQMHGIEEQFEKLDTNGLTYLRVGTPAWKHEFETPQEILFEVIPYGMNDKFESVVRMVELKVGKKLERLDDFTFSYGKPNETRRTFETRMIKALAVTDGHFFHENRKYKFDLVDNTQAPLLVNNTLEV